MKFEVGSWMFGRNSMKKFEFEKLDVYEKSLDFIDKIYDLFESLPYKLQRAIGNNLIRASRTSR